MLGSNRDTKNTGSVSIQEYRSLADITDEFLADWRNLEDSTFEDNVYLSPDFVIPAIARLTPDIDFVIFAVRTNSPNSEKLIAVGVFEEGKSCMRFPFRYLTAYQSIHSFLSGLMISQDSLDMAVSGFFDYLRNSAWSAIRFDDFPDGFASNTHICKLLDQKRIVWHQLSQYERAVLSNTALGLEDGPAISSKKTRKSIARNHKKLSECGEVEYRILLGENVTDEVMQAFVNVENSGWKKDEGSSLASNKNETMFFNEMMSLFAKRKRAFFCELRLDGEVICSTSNMISGKTGFAFKIGRSSEYDKFGVGMITESLFVEDAQNHLSGLNSIDSGSQPGSYIEKLWDGRRVLTSGFYSLNWYTSLYLSGLKLCGAFKSKICD